MSILELIGVVVGLIYLYLEYHANIWLWAANIVMPAIYIFVYHDAGFYADMGINIYYLIISIYGWYKWRFVKTKRVEKEVPITHTPIKMILPLIVVTIAVFVAICYVLINFTDSTVPYGDSFTTAVSIVGMWMLAKKYYQQWIVWIIVEPIIIATALQAEMYATALLYVGYTVIAVMGYFKWKREAKEI